MERKPRSSRCLSRNSFNCNASFDAGRLQGDSHSPLAMPGRSMRNVEEQMSTLRKENFNLKLRLYFMEESQLGHNRTNHSGESLSKQLIDAKIEAEVLRKTVEEKTELLKDAARAISQHEEMQLKAETESQALIDELQQHLHHYEEMEAAQGGDTRAMLEEKLKHLDSEVLRLRQELVEAGMRQIACQDQLKSAQAEHQETLSSCEAKIQELAIKNAELLEQFEKGMQCSDEANVSKVNNNKMEWERKQLKSRLDEYAANISRQEVDLCLLRRQKPFASLNAKRRQQAALFPLANPYCRNPRPGPGLQRTASNSSLNSNFSAISVLGSSKVSSSSATVSSSGGNGYAMPVDAEKSQRYQRMLHNDCARELFRLPIPAPGNHLQTSYSLPSLAGLRQFFAKMWGNMNLM